MSAFTPDAVDLVVAGGASLLAGVVNALAGGGTLISFPTLVGLGVPAVSSNVTNTVSLVPGYLAGSWAQRADLGSQLSSSRRLVAAALVGGLGGSILLLAIPAGAFRAAVPYLILMSCALLLAQDHLRRLIAARTETPGSERKAAKGWLVSSAVLAAAVYGGFFGAGLGIMLLAVLGLFSSENLVKVNAVKQVLSFVINLVAAAFFAFSNQVSWELVPIMAVGSLIGGAGGGRLVRLVNPSVLRRVVVVAGVAVAVSFWVG